MSPIGFIIGHMAIEPAPACMCSIMWTSGARAVSTGDVSAWRLAGAVFLIAVLFNFPWELAQSSLYIAMPPFPMRLWRCFVASLGDGVLLLLMWVAGWAVFRQKMWFRPLRAVRYMAMVVGGFILAVIVEAAALEAGRWSYEPQMPRVWNLGVAPLLQMVLLPPVTFALLARTRSPRSGGGSRAGHPIALTEASDA